MKDLIGKIALVLLSIVVALGVAEVGLRFAVSTPLSYESVLRGTLDRPERLFPANHTATFNVRDLYDGADSVTLRVSGNRFIEPEPDANHRYRVLFLGGSTTESIYVPESERWVALLNEPRVLAAYNAGQSGANTIDMYFTYRYLTQEQGMSFDLVVLATGANDLGWLSKFDNLGRRMVIEEYRDALFQQMMGEFRKSQSTDGWMKEKSAVYFVVSQGVQKILDVLSRQAPAAELSSTEPPGDERSDANERAGNSGLDANSVTQIYVRMRREALQNFADEEWTAGATLFSRYPHIEAQMHRYHEAATHNLTTLNELVESTGARLLVISEAASWLADPASFHTDLRIPSGMSSWRDYDELTALRNRLYLEAAAKAGALTYDLAADVGPVTNGPRGGQYMYDNMHYTPMGCRLVAEHLRPVLKQALEQGAGMAAPAKGAG